MERKLLLSLSGLLLFACGTTNKQAIDLTVEGAAGKTVYFDRFENNRPIRLDSVVLDAVGKGSVRAPATALDFYRLAMDGEQLIVALDSGESLAVEATIGRLSTPISITGSPHSEALHQFYADAKTYDSERERLSAAMASMSDTALIGQFNRLTRAYDAQIRKFIAAHSSSPVALTAVAKFDMQKELPLFKQVRDSLRKSMPRSGFFAMFRDQVDRLEQQEVAIKMQEEEMKRLSNLLPLGSVAPEIRQQTPEGGTVALSDLRGKVVLIDFWASWCRPCRIENPNVKRVYERFAKKGFEILGVSLDRDHAAWVKAIHDDGLPWKHASDLGFWNNAAAQEYGVGSIPYTVLIDKDGKILEKGLRGDELEAKLAALLGG